jgi:hypothetical protein
MVVYDPRMPSRVPHRLFIGRLILQFKNNMVTYLRFLLVCFIWLGLVPFLARWIWRFYFRFGDWTTLSKDSEKSEKSFFEEGFFGWLKGTDLWSGILRDCFQGQIITICLVAVFVVVFLIREWVMQAIAIEEPIPIIEEREQEQEWIEEEPRQVVFPIREFPPIEPEEFNPGVRRQGILREPFEEDDIDGDDFDGLWDILGMQGPIIGLLHNTVFSALMIALAVGLGVWLPFMFGKTALGALVLFLD